MHKGKVIFTGLLLIALALIISYGCGGGDVITNPTPVASGNSGYLIIRVVWPQQGNSGNLLMLSGSEKEITASMPEDTKCVKIKVLQKANMNNLLGEALINMPETTIKIEHLSAEPVIVIAETYDTIIDPNDPNSSNLKPLSVSELDVVIRVSANSFNLDMGDYLLTVEPAIKKIALGETVKITATLTLKDSTGNSVASDGSLEGREIEFTITGNAPQKVNTGIDGKVEIQATGNEIGQMYIKAEFKPIPSDPNTFKVAETSVDVSGSGRYVLTVNSDTEHIFLRYRFENTKTSSLEANAIPQASGEATITGKLMYIAPSLPGEPSPVPTPVEGKEIEFTATNTNNLETITLEPAITDVDGNYTTKFIATGPGTITIKGTLKDDPGTTAQCSIQVDRDYYLELQGGYVNVIPDFKTVDTELSINNTYMLSLRVTRHA